MLKTYIYIRCSAFSFVNVNVALLMITCSILLFLDLILEKGGKEKRHVLIVVH